MPASRNWKSFQDRWNSGRFEQFLLWSVVVHLAIAAVAWVPAREAQQRQQEFEEQVRVEQARQAEEKQEAKVEAEKQVHEILKKELAEEQLREFYNELTEDFLAMEQIDELWDDLLEWLDPELEELALLFENPDETGLSEIELKVQELKEKLLDRLTEKLANDKRRLLADELLKKARDLAKEIAEQYQKQLAERLGRPLGDDLRKLVDTETNDVEQRLEKVEAQLQAALDAAKEAETQLTAGGERLRQLAREAKQADDDGDTKAAATAKSQTQQQRSGLAAAGAKLAVANKSLGQAADLLGRHFPGMAKDLKAAQDQPLADGQKKSTEATGDAAAGKSADAAEKADGAADDVRRVRETAERVQVAAQLQRALEQAARGARDAGEQATAASRTAAKRTAANEANDAGKKTQADAESAAGEKKASGLEDATDKLSTQLAKVTRSPSAEGDKEGRATNDSQKPGEPNGKPSEKTNAKTGDKEPGQEGDAARQLAAQAQAAKSTVGEAKKSLAEKSDGDAAQKLATAAQQFRKLAGEIEKSAGPATKSVGDELSRELDSLQRGKLAGQIRKDFDKLYEEKALPAILKQVGEATDKRAQAERVFSDAFQGELQKEMRKLFGENIPGEVAADQQVRKTAGERLAQADPGDGEKSADNHGEKATGEKTAGEKSNDKTGAKSKSPGQGSGEKSNAPKTDDSGEPSSSGGSGSPARSPRIAEVVQNAETAANNLANKVLPGIVQSGATNNKFAALAQPGADTPEQAANFLNRLDNLKKKLGTGRRDFLGEADGTGLAAARRRHEGRKGSLMRLGYGDADGKAYREMADAMKARGTQTGQAFELQTASGDVSAADNESVLRPALVSASEPPPAPEPSTEPRVIPQPKFQSHRFLGIPFVTSDTITIDGELADWKDLPVFELDPVVKGARAPKHRPEKQRAHVAYCSRGLLIAYAVTDTTDAIEDSVPLAAFWMNDCVEIYVDTLNTKFDVRGESNTHQFFAFPFGHATEREVSAYESRAVTEAGKIDWKRVPFNSGELPKAAKKTDHGWTIELLIPKSFLRKGAIVPGRVIGFNLQLDTGSDLYYYWTCAKQIISSQHPNTWGDVQFLGSDAKAELLDDKDAAVKSFFPGQSLRLRVTDPDMNLNDASKDKISAVVRSASGDAETLILEETEVGSGIFIGAATTALNIGSPRVGRLEVFEGETITVEYIDQARAFGERNVPVETKAVVSSVGVKLKGRD